MYVRLWKPGLRCKDNIKVGITGAESRDCWFSLTLSWVWFVKIVCYYHQFAKKKGHFNPVKSNWTFFITIQYFPLFTPKFFITPSTLSMEPVSAALPVFARRKEVDGTTNLKSRIQNVASGWNSQWKKCLKVQYYWANTSSHWFHRWQCQAQAVRCYNTSGSASRSRRLGNAAARLTEPQISQTIFHISMYVDWVQQYIAHKHV